MRIRTLALVGLCATLGAALAGCGGPSAPPTIAVTVQAGACPGFPAPDWPDATSLGNARFHAAPNWTRSPRAQMMWPWVVAPVAAPNTTRPTALYAANLQTHGLVHIGNCPTRACPESASLGPAQPTALLVSVPDCRQGRVDDAFALWDPATGRLDVVQPFTQGPLVAHAFDGRWLVYAPPNHADWLRVRDIETGKDSWFWAPADGFVYGAVGSRGMQDVQVLDGHAYFFEERQIGAATNLARLMDGNLRNGTALPVWQASVTHALLEPLAGNRLVWTDDHLDAADAEARSQPGHDIWTHAPGSQRFASVSGTSPAAWGASGSGDLVAFLASATSQDVAHLAIAPADGAAPPRPVAPSLGLTGLVSGSDGHALVQVVGLRSENGYGPLDEGMRWVDLSQFH